MDIEKLKKEKDRAYWERNQLVSALSKIHMSHLAKHPKDEEWEDDWRTIVVMYPYSKEKGAPQITWHIHDNDIPMFDHLDYRVFEWDGHDTEEKYRRLRQTNPPKVEK